MLTRREFFGAAAATAAATTALALPSDRFRWSINTNMFTPLKPHPETGFKMAARFGFHAVEPWANQMQKYLEQPPEVYKKLLDEAGITISSIASGGEYFDTSKLQATLEDHAKNAIVYYEAPDWKRQSMTEDEEGVVHGILATSQAPFRSTGSC